MRKKTLTIAVVCALSTAFLFNSCIGSFTLTNKLKTWNDQIGSKFVNELVFFAFWVLPVYEVSAIADLLVLNSIEFWSGNNPVADNGTREIEGNDGIYLVTTDETGYTITSKTDGSTVRFDFNVEDNSWSIELPDGSSQTILTFIDDTHVALPDYNGEQVVVELSEQGVYAYQQMAIDKLLATR